MVQTLLERIDSSELFSWLLPFKQAQHQARAAAAIRAAPGHSCLCWVYTCAASSALDQQHHQHFMPTPTTTISTTSHTHYNSHSKRQRWLQCLSSLAALTSPRLLLAHTYIAHRARRELLPTLYDLLLLCQFIGLLQARKQRAETPLCARLIGDDRCRTAAGGAMCFHWTLIVCLFVCYCVHKNLRVWGSV